jgi:ADP-heptose:LPS heptosyltransferase
MDFLPILYNPNVAFYSLQKGERARELTELPSKIRIHDLEPQLDDFADLALICDQLDLIITMDTTVAHVAGAIGKPVWTLLAYAADWYWGSEGEATPWYSTMRLFRQDRPGNWVGAIARVAADLEKETDGSTRGMAESKNRRFWPRYKHQDLHTELT